MADRRLWGTGTWFGGRQEVYGGAVASSLQHSPRQAFSSGALTTLLLGHCHQLTLPGPVRRVEERDYLSMWGRMQCAHRSGGQQ